MMLNWGFWTLFGVLQAATWLLSPIGGGNSNALRLNAIALFNAYMWALLTPFIFRLAARASRSQRRRLGWAAFIFVLGICVAAIVAVLAASVHGGLPWNAEVSSPEHTRYSFWALSRWYFEELVLFYLVFGAGIATDMFRKYQAREREAARLREQATLLETERAELNARLADARLAVLRSQLNPHFLFNTLNAVSALVVKDPVGVRNMIALLSELLRSALTADEEEIPIEREMDLLRLYLEILEIRYQGQLRTRLTVEPSAHDALVPRMILQPLVENAMKHGVAPSGGSGLIEIRAERVGDDLVLSVRDSGHVSEAPVVSDGAGVGLRLTRQRLTELYGTEQTLELTEAGDGGTIARIHLPFHTRADVRLSVDSRP